MNQKRNYNSLKLQGKFRFLRFGLLSMVICLSSQQATANLETNLELEGASVTVQSTVTGTVTDSSGEPLPGANVLVKGTTNGTQTDFDGNYTITADSDATLVVSYIGFATQEVAVNGQSSVNFTMTEDANQLEEVVLTGYSKQSTRDITGSVSVVKGEDLAATSPQNFEQALQGQSAGVTIGGQNSPGGATAVRIRGYGTINGNDPLYIIDGTPTGAGLTDINPNDIESIQILKDASSAAIYGNRAANGVIIITTKTGSRNSKVNFSANAYVSVDFLPSSIYPDLASPQQIADALFRAFDNDGTPGSNPQFPNGPGTLPVYLSPQGAQTADESTYSLVNNRITRANQQGTDWFNEYFDSAITKNYNVSASGGTSTSNFFTSISALNQEGVGLETGFDRYTLRANSSFSITDRFRIGENITVSYSQAQQAPGYDVNNGPVASLYRAHPLIPVYDVGGNFAGSGVGGLGNAANPIAIATRNKDNENVTFRALGNFYGEYDIFKGLTFKSNLGFDIRTFNQVRFQPPAYEGESVNTSTILFEQNQLSRTYTWFNTLNYNTNLGENTTLDVLVGTEFNKQNFRQIDVNRTDFLVFDPPLRFLGNGSGGFDGNGFGSIQTYFSTFGKADIKIADKYLFSGTLRRDETSLFAEDKRSGVFPSGSVGWRISSEDFLADSDVFSSLLLKVGYGTIGNNGNIRTTARANTVGPDVSRFNYPTSSGSSATGFGLSRRGNPDIEWETTTTLNVGITARLWDRLDLDLEVYDARTEDLLLEVPGDPTVLGQRNSIPFNLGEATNKGFDLSLGYGNSQSEGDFKYNLGFNISAYKNEVVNLDPENPTAFINGDRLRDQIPSRTQAGQPLASFYGKIWEGIDANGRVIFTQDPDGGGDLRTFIGSPHPDFTYGLNFSGNYKDFDFAMLWQGSQGNDIYNFTKFFIDFEKFPGARSVDFVTENGLPAVTQDSNLSASEAEPSTKYVEDGSYLRMKNVVIGYSLPRTLSDKLKVEKIRFYLQGRNLITLTDYSGLDPEVNLRNFTGSNANLTIGVDSGQFPVNRSIIFGINVSL